MTAPRHAARVTVTAHHGAASLRVDASCTCGGYTQTVHTPRLPDPASDALTHAEDTGLRLHAYHLAAQTPPPVDLTRLDAHLATLPAADPTRCRTCGRTEDDHPYRHPFARWAPTRPERRR